MNIESESEVMVSLTNEISIDWSILPVDLWSLIGDHLSDDRFDATRFRSVCSSFRTLIPRFNPECSPLPRFSFSSNDSFVSLTTVLKLRRPFSSAGAWLVKAILSSDKVLLLDCLSCRRISEIDSVKTLRLSEFQISEVARTYSLRYVWGSSSVAGVNKLILCPHPGSESVFVIYDNGKLGFAKNGDTEITLMDDQIIDYDDLAVFRGQPYVIDRWGTVSWIDASMKLVQFSLPMSSDRGRKHLVVCDGELYVVERYFEAPNDTSSEVNIAGLRFGLVTRQRHRLDYPHPRSVDFKVFKLDEEWGRWVKINNLGQKSFVLTYDCSFAVSASEFDEFEPNCIYFTDQLDMDLALRQLGRQGGCIFKLDNGVIQNLELSPGYFNIFSEI